VPSSPGYYSSPQQLRLNPQAMFSERFSAQDPSINFNVDGASDFNDFLLFAARYGQSGQSASL
jgi:hypothetical protein|tara:strand:- start:193 stop:381 length:189 start_codon:yes stop_codon:yes gene_type:complete